MIVTMSKLEMAVVTHILCCVVLVLLTTGVSGQGEQVIQYRIQEEVPEDTWIGNLADSLGLNATRGSLEFGFLSESARHREYFSLCCGGELRTQGRLDRDALCPGSMDLCQLSVDVTVRGRDTFYIAKVLLEVQDIEDNTPQFPAPRHVLYLSESTQLLAAFALPTAADPDASTLTYTLTPSLPQFELQVSDGECHLVVKEALDREERATYDLVMRATDVAGNSATLDIEVSVLDVNDNAPRFEQADYAVYVFENAAVGSTLLQVHATDADSGAHGEVMYSLSSQSQEQYGHVLRMEARTGELLLLSPLNYGDHSEYSIRVVAKDQATSSLAAYTTVTLHIRDLNDHAPQISINALTAVPEHATIGTFVAHVSVTDQDGGDNGKFECSLNDTHFELKRMFPTEYKLVTAGMLDREQQGQYRVRVLCTDLGSPPQESGETVDVMVEDINDHAPQFERPVYEVSVAEDIGLGSSLVQVRATDGDVGENGRVTYSMRGAATAVVGVDPDTGVVTVRHLLDHEERSVWECQLLATDHAAQDPLSTTATLRVVVRDVNDEAPHFPAPSTTLTVAENQAPGAAVGDVLAYDRDAPPYNVLTYRLAAPSSYFSVSPRLGSVRTLQVLDRERTDRYNLRIIAQDQDGLSSEVLVQIVVQDVNDNAPVIQAPSTPLQVSSAARVGHIVTHVRATDLDTSHNAQLRYSIASASSPGLFSVNPLSGSVSVADDLNDYKDSTVTVTFRVQDRGEPILETSAQYKFFINSTALPMTSPGSKKDVISDSSLIIILLLSVTAVISFVLILIIVILIRRRHRTPGMIGAVAAPGMYDAAAPDTAAALCRAENGLGTVSTVDGEMQKINNMSYSSQNQENAQKSRRVHFKDGTAGRNVNQGYEPNTEQPGDFGAAVSHPEYKEEARHRLLYGSKGNSTRQPVLNAPRHANIPGPPDLDWERGSLDSGRGASEEENTSSETVPVHARSRSRSNHPRSSSSRSHQGARVYPSNSSQNLNPNPNAPPVPRRLAPPPVKGHAKPPAPEPPAAAPFSRNRSRAAETHDDDTLDSAATTMSGEYVLNGAGQLAHDVYV